MLELNAVVLMKFEHAFSKVCGVRYKIFLCVMGGNMNQLFFKDFMKDRVKIGFLSRREETDEELMEKVNAWMGRIQNRRATVVNVESVYNFAQTGTSVVHGFTGVRVWVVFEAKEA